MADRQPVRRHFPVFVATSLASVAAAADKVVAVPVAVPVAALETVPMPVGAAEPPASAFSFVHRGLLASSVMVVPAAAEHNQKRHRRPPLSCRGPMPMPIPVPLGHGVARPFQFQSPSRRCVSISSMKMSLLV